MSLRITLFAAVITAAATLVGSETANACTYPGPIFRVHDAPTNGIVVLEMTCQRAVEGDCYAVGDTLPVLDTETGEAVPGKIVVVTRERGYAAGWKPVEPLVEGHTYRIDLDPDVADARTTFMARAPIDLVGADVLWGASLESSWEVVDTLSCRTYLDSCGGNEKNIHLRTRNEPTVELAVKTRPWLERNGNSSGFGSPDAQFTVRTAFWPDGEAEPALGEPSWQLTQHHERSFEAAASAYCYRVELTSLLDDSVAVQQGCVPHGDLGPVEETLMPRDELDAELRDCIEPPAGAVPFWCEAMAACPNGSVEACEVFARTCTGDPTPTDGLTPSDLPIAGAAGGANSPSRSPESQAAGGCSIGPSPATGAPLLLLGVALLGLATRRRG